MSADAAWYILARELSARRPIETWKEEAGRLAGLAEPHLSGCPATFQGGRTIRRRRDPEFRAGLAYHLAQSGRCGVRRVPSWPRAPNLVASIFGPARTARIGPFVRWVTGRWEAAGLRRTSWFCLPWEEPQGARGSRSFTWISWVRDRGERGGARAARVEAPQNIWWQEERNRERAVLGRCGVLRVHESRKRAQEVEEASCRNVLRFFPDLGGRRGPRGACRRMEGRVVLRAVHSRIPSAGTTSGRSRWGPRKRRVTLGISCGGRNTERRREDVRGSPSWGPTRRSAL